MATRCLKISSNGNKILKYRQKALGKINLTDNSALKTYNFSFFLASFVLGLVMVGVIVLSRRCKVNPDNVATPIAASLGDLITLSMLAGIARYLFTYTESQNRWPSLIIII